VNDEKRYGCGHEPAHLTGSRKLSRLCLSRPARDEPFPTSGASIELVRDPFLVPRNQMVISAQDSISLKSPRFVKRIYDRRKNGFASCRGIVIYRIVGWSNEITLLMAHACSSDAFWCWKRLKGVMNGYD